MVPGRIPDEWMDVFEGGRSDHPLVALDVFHITHSTIDPGVSVDPLRAADIVEIACHATGDGDGPPWVAIVRLADGRWAYVSYTLQITGDLFWTYVYASRRERLWWWACTDDDRERLTSSLSTDEQADELVQLDMLIQSEDPEAHEIGERRMRQLLRLGKIER